MLSKKKRVGVVGMKLCNEITSNIKELEKNNV
jgi:hypothetical protein